MTARTGMSDLITKLRQNANAGTADYTIAGQTYWSDNHLEDLLDRNRADIFDEPLRSEITYGAGGTAFWYDYYFANGNVEQATSGSAAWEVEDGAGNAIGTSEYTVNYNAQHIRFTNSTNGSALYLNYRSYNLEMASADTWQAKAASIADAAFDVKTDNHDLKRSQKFDHYVKMATYWRARALSSQGANSSEGYLVRSDVNA